MTDILQAARSYYGLSDATVRKTEWFTDEGKMILCFEIVTEGEDFIGIVERMKRLQEDQASKPNFSDVPWPVPNVEVLRTMYDLLSESERASYGSFAAFVRYSMRNQQTVPAISDERTMQNWATEGRKLAHIDAPETEEPAQMDAVWLLHNEASEAQRLFASDWQNTVDDVIRYLVPWDMLTQEQRQKAKEAKP